MRFVDFGMGVCMDRRSSGHVNWYSSYLEKCGCSAETPVSADLLGGRGNSNSALLASMGLRWPRCALS